MDHVVHVGDLAGHVELKELEPSGQHLGGVTVGMTPVVEVEVQIRAGSEVAQHVGELGAGLFVLPCPGQEHRYLDLGHQPRQVTGIGLFGPVDQ